MRAPTRSTNIALRPTQTTKTSDISENKIKEFRKSGLYIGAPAKVVGVDDYESLQCIDVETVIQEEMDDGRVLGPMIIRRVFVKLPNSGGFKQKYPVQIGDHVTLCFAHKSLSAFLDGDGGSVTQSRNFIQAPRDCWAELNGGTRRTHTKPSTTDWILEGPKTTITISPDGNITTSSENITTMLMGDYTLSCSSVAIAAPTTVDGTLGVTGKVTAGSSELGSSVSTGGVAGVTAVATPDKTLTITNGIITGVA